MPAAWVQLLGIERHGVRYARGMLVMMPLAVSGSISGVHVAWKCIGIVAVQTQELVFGCVLRAEEGCV
jgi:hypothetical protein